MNVVVITSILRVSMSTSIYSPAERLEQIKQSITSVRERVPSSWIVLLEGNTATEEEISELKSLVDEYLTIDIRFVPKSIGEAVLLATYLQSENFQRVKAGLTSLSKLSGRYRLTDAYDFSKFPADKYIAKFRLDWQGKPVYETRYYRIPAVFLDSFLERFFRALADPVFQQDGMDIEHLYGLYSMFPHEQSILDKPIGLTGNIAPDGTAIFD